ncbi:putative glycoside hydrolase family 71 [Diplodia seriata]|uniref:Putative glycoside hydrolase family 71 n=1 Tax=Diplodia seriata TaxID=420778 RepID=A0A0G2DRJ3_9PEZI|nr:putative glycoside hydrolase family 71 [Diplodia seriata]
MAFNRGFLAALVSFLVLTTANLGAAKALTQGVFAHYMVGTVYEDHAHQDIKDASAMGLDGFALNIGDPSQTFVRQTLNYMFDHARDNYPDFKLFISMDLWAAGSAKKGLDDFDDLLRDYMGHAAYYKGPNGYPFISSFADGGVHNTTWMDWRNKWANEIYFVPDFDGSKGYYLSDPGWWEYWGDVVDGIFSWESTWPLRGHTDTSSWKNESYVREGAFSNEKAYMMGLSMLQYENSNDGPESHYIGNIWPEQNNETDPTRYATQADFPHNGIRPLLSSFISSYKAGKEIMEPPTGEDAVGALWYKSIHSSTVCPDTDALISKKPDGYSAASDVLTWAVIVSSIGGPYSIRGFSGGQELQTFYLTAGYNFGTFSSLQEGDQRMELLDASGNVVMAASGGRCVTSTCPDGIYNLNPQILELTMDTSEKTCNEPITDMYPPISTAATWGTRLFSFNKCTPGMKSDIQRAYEDFHRLTDQNGVGDKIDWSSAAALEFLAPPAHTLLHELLHIHLVADSENDTPNPDIYDLSINWRQYRLDGDPIVHEERAYGPMRSDNLAYFALAQWVRAKNGYYPYLPVIRNQELTRNPAVPGGRVAYDTEGGDLVIGVADDDEEVDNLSLCSDYDDLAYDGTEIAHESLNLTALIDLSAYPTAYQEELAEFLEMYDALGDDE